jgi:hypothetical protein
MGVPVTSSLIDQAAYWQVPMPFAATVAWVKSHPPTGLPDSGGSSSSSGGGVQTVGFEYSAADTTSWIGADLEIGIASGTATTSFVRADGVLEVLDPVPLPDNAKGPRLRVTIADGCPTRDANDVGVTNAGDGLTTSLLPAASPIAGLICRYAGANDAVSSSQRLDAAGAGQLAAAAGKTQLTHLDDVETSCPMDDGSIVVIALSYPSRADVDLWWRSAGCQWVSNGFIMGSPDDALTPFNAAPIQSRLPLQSPGAVQSPLPKPGPMSPVPIMKQSPPAA